MTDSIKLRELYEAERKRLSMLTDGKGDYAHPVFGDGNANASVVFIGEAPGANEAAEGKPFVGKAGMQLDHMLAVSGIDRKELYVTNAVKFRPWILTETLKGARARNRTPSLSEIKQGIALLNDELMILQPRIIVTLGNTPLTAMNILTGKAAGGIGTLHGQAIECERYNSTIFPLYHPASGIYNRALVDVMENDLRKLKTQI